MILNYMIFLLLISQIVFNTRNVTEIELSDFYKVIVHFLKRRLHN